MFDMASTAPTSTALPLGKCLASTDKKTRDKAITSLCIFLSDSQDELSKSDITKLWKGIFYCFWMSDKPLVQQALASELAEITLSIATTALSLAFLRGFWETIVREWDGIDRLRIDKYYMLVRRFVNASFRLLIRSQWDKNAVEDYNDIMSTEGGPLCPTSIRVPSGLSYHLADIYNEELDKALGSQSLASCPAPLGSIIAPFLALAAQTPTATVYKRIQSALLEPLLSALSDPIPHYDQLLNQEHRTNALPHIFANACFENPEIEGQIDRNTLKKKLLRKVFEVASGSETRDPNRRKMYKIWKENNADDDSGM